MVIIIWTIIETVYTYDSSKYTHQFVSKEQKGIKDANGQKTRIWYTPFGQVSLVCLAAVNQPVMMTMGMRPSGFGRRRPLHRSTQAVLNSPGVGNERFRPSMNGGIIMGSTS